MRRDLSEDELAELAAMRGVRVPASALKERGAKVKAPTPSMMANENQDQNQENDRAR
jgi:hypothetical protein